MPQVLPRGYLSRHPPDDIYQYPCLLLSTSSQEGGGGGIQGDIGTVGAV